LRGSRATLGPRLFALRTAELSERDGGGIPGVWLFGWKLSGTKTFKAPQERNIKAMKTIDNIEFEATHWEIVECVDLSVQAASKKGRGRRSGNQETRMRWEPDLKHNRMAIRLRLLVSDADGAIIIKLVLRGNYAVLGTSEIDETPNLLNMSKAAALAIAYEVWDYAMDYLSKLTTPVSMLSIPRPPNEGLLAEMKLPGFSLN